jgi:hypothetical protein
VALGKSKDGRNKQNQTELYGDTGRLVYLAWKKRSSLRQHIQASQCANRSNQGRREAMVIS